MVGSAAIAPGKTEATSWRSVDAETGKIADIAGLEQLARDFPDSSSVRLRLLTAYIREEDKPAARVALAWLLDRDYAFSAAGQATLAAFFEDFDGALIERIAGAPRIVAQSTVTDIVPAGARLLEGIVATSDDRWIATSIVDRALFLSAAMGEWVRKDIPGAGSLAGIVFDQESDTLWVSSGVYEPTPDPQSAFRGLIGWDREQDTLRRLAAPADATPSDLFLAADGRLYASDPLNGSIYSAGPGDERLEAFIGSGTFRSPQGLVPVDGGRKLLVSDYRYGLATVNLATRRVERVRTSLAVALDGIDGMWVHGERIVAVQNGISPQRLLLIELDRRATAVVAVEILELGHPDWLEPLGGTIHDGAFHYIASGQWNRYGEGGVARTDLPPLPTVIRRVELPPRGD